MLKADPGKYGVFQTCHNCAPDNFWVWSEFVYCARRKLQNMNFQCVDHTISSGEENLALAVFISVEAAFFAKRIILFTRHIPCT